MAPGGKCANFVDTNNIPKCNNNVSVWFMQPDKDFQICANRAKKKPCWTTAENTLHDGEPVGVKVLFYLIFFFNFRCICLPSGPKHPFHHARAEESSSISVGSRATQKALEYLQRHISEWLGWKATEMFRATRLDPRWMSLLKMSSKMWKGVNVFWGVFFGST